MENNSALTKLNDVYQLYAGIVQNSRIVCKKGCDTCCTVNVSLTTLEAAAIVNDPGAAAVIKSPDMVWALEEVTTKKRYQPKITMNGHAQCCIDRKTPPEEENDPLWGVCPFLKDSTCAIYPVRPFACRCMVSTTLCHETGVASMDAFILAMNQALMQYIEHIDSSGYTANLSDMLTAYTSQPDRTHPHDWFSDATGVKNRSIPILMVPPAFHKRAEDILKKLDWQ